MKSIVLQSVISKECALFRRMPAGMSILILLLTTAATPLMGQGVGIARGVITDTDNGVPVPGVTVKGTLLGVCLRRF